MRIVVSSIGTGEGKSWFAQGLAWRWARRGLRVAALKPFETGVVTVAADARALEVAAGAAAGAFESAAFFRGAAAASPVAAAWEAGVAQPDVEAIAGAIQGFESEVDVAIVESAGGLFVPVAMRADGGLRLFVELLREDDVVFVAAQNRLGVLSHCLALVAAIGGAERRALLVAPEAPDEATFANSRILRAAGLRVYELRRSTGTRDDLADAVEESGAAADLGV
jgi:dethiobiotin synthetase